MYEYFMFIDGESYNAVFFNASEAYAFIEDNLEEDRVVTIEGKRKVSPFEVLLDDTLDYFYKIEIVTLYIRPKFAKKAKNVFELESELLRLGFRISG